MEQMEFDDLGQENDLVISGSKSVEIEDGERDCPVCGGSGVCYACERGRAVAKEFEEANKKEREKRRKERQKKRIRKVA